MRREVNIHTFTFSDTDMFEQFVFCLSTQSKYTIIPIETLKDIND